MDPRNTVVVPTASSPNNVRNVVLVGPSVAGKTTFVEALPIAASLLPRPGTVVYDSTVYNYGEAEICQQRSVGRYPDFIYLYDSIKVNPVDARPDTPILWASCEPQIARRSSSRQTRASVDSPRSAAITKLGHSQDELSGDTFCRKKHVQERNIPLSFLLKTT
ncbi:hypothetical protein [Mycobacterium leprae]|uniref:hypothetical protein n=1 Tax=Mycobacterium leprae TaxID=1769 RepID=UPI000673E06D|nr:hypothetical protein [Mycobacterium leprae]OAR21235.1 hypothetical protein A8144_07210 [Mycobacterium leprae 3125609]OAX71375.1 hypothetical protein A3216_06290 [Mycobacterium leprae 7935681]